MLIRREHGGYVEARMVRHLRTLTRGASNIDLALFELLFTGEQIVCSSPDDARYGYQEREDLTLASAMVAE